jgi:abortive infection bacteriophage resistance protein
MRYRKPALLLADQVQLLISRGLDVPDVAAAEKELGRLSYYRLAGYFLYFQGGPGHQFKPGTTLDEVLMLYRFDEALRNLMFKGIAPIEIALRAQLAYQGAIKAGPFWYKDRQHTLGRKDGKGHDIHNANIRHIRKEAKRSGEPFIQHYFATYSSPALPPAWMVFEVVSFGTLSKVLSHLRPAITNDVARFFGVGQPILVSWITALCNLLNRCAHHSRLWNRKLTVRPTLVIKQPIYAWPANASILPNADLYGLVAYMVYLLRAIDAPGASVFVTELKQLFQFFGAISPQGIGFPANWEQGAFWL